MVAAAALLCALAQQPPRPAAPSLIGRSGQQPAPLALPAAMPPRLGGHGARPLVPAMDEPDVDEINQVYEAHVQFYTTAKATCMLLSVLSLLIAMFAESAHHRIEPGAQCVCSHCAVRSLARLKPDRLTARRPFPPPQLPRHGDGPLLGLCTCSRLRRQQEVHDG